MEDLEEKCHPVPSSEWDGSSGTSSSCATPLHRSQTELGMQQTLLIFGTSSKGRAAQWELGVHQEPSFSTAPHTPPALMWGGHRGLKGVPNPLLQSLTWQCALTALQGPLCHRGADTGQLGGHGQGKTPCAPPGRPAGADTQPHCPLTSQEGDQRSWEQGDHETTKAVQPSPDSPLPASHPASPACSQPLAPHSCSTEHGKSMGSPSSPLSCTHGRYNHPPCCSASSPAAPVAARCSVPMPQAAILGQ